jgi:sulfite dehydrogenase (quinone) subunit SoeB
VEDREPACVMVCPVNARHFGDLGDPDSAISQLVAERRGRDLMPELGYKPVNKYLPPRPGRMPRAVPAPVAQPSFPLPPTPSSSGDKLLRWIDRLLSR